MIDDRQLLTGEETYFEEVRVDLLTIHGWLSHLDSFCVGHKVLRVRLAG